MTTASGTYLLLLRADEEQTIEVGALGSMAVRPGVYVYVGSAFGPGGLRARVERHLRAPETRHWHVDYLRVVTSPEAVWYTHDDTRRECLWATVVRALPEATVPMENLGASDCDCSAHLFHFEAAPRFATFQRRVREGSSNHASIEQRPIPDE